MTTTQRRRSCLHRYRFSRCVCWQYLASTHNRRIYARCFTVTTFPVTNSIHRVAVIGVPLLNGFLHAFILSYTKEKGNAHSSPTYSLWSLKWESPARNRMKVAQEEIFGPVMAVMSFTSEEEAIRLANDVKYGLAAYVWTNDMKRGHRVAQAIESGMAWVNSPNVRDLRIPFGGTKYSGIGREGGHYSFDFYTEVQVVHVAVGDPPIPAFGKGEKQTALSAEQA
ncbi:aldehyde dehydrogenase family protein [Geobacillus stearothermophilus]|nr:aldehyde dehydrogenase family protein [Geobacillus sp. DSP4a]QHN50366.1 aldehyde dehydrogenase family protein [Geobacillus stearothermophilus]